MIRTCLGGLLLALLLISPVFAAETSALSAPDATPVVVPASGYTPMPQVQGASSGDLFNSKVGYIHPFISVNQVYTDNLFNEPDREESDWLTVVSPGIWVAVPSMRTPPEKVTTLNTSPGGMALTRFVKKSDHRFQGYAGYLFDQTYHQDNSSQDDLAQRGEAGLQVNLRGGLSIDVLDVYENTYDPYSTGANLERQLDRYDSNLFNTIAVYEISPKTKLRADFSYYTLSYDKDRNSFRDRDDLSGSLYAFYKTLPKTGFFLQYEYLDVDYDQQVQNDSEEHHFFAGVKWDFSAKSKGMFKGGYGKREESGSNGEDREDFISELQLDHEFTPRTSLSVRGVRKTNESDISGTNGLLTHLISASYNQDLTEKVSMRLELSYINDSYDGKITIGSKTAERDDDYYRAGIGFGWALQPWLTLGGGYSFTKRESNFSEFDYDTNTAYINLTAAM